MSFKISLYFHLFVFHHDLSQGQNVPNDQSIGFQYQNIPMGAGADFPFDSGKSIDLCRDPGQGEQGTGTVQAMIIDPPPEFKSLWLRCVYISLVLSISLDQS